MESARPDAVRTAVAAMLATVLAVAACAGTIDSPAPSRRRPRSRPWGSLDRPVRRLVHGRAARLRAEEFPPSWVVEDGELHALPGSGADLITRDTFGDFELEFEWRVGPGGNSGVIYRVVECEAPSWTSGPEYQVLDDGEHPDGGIPERRRRHSTG